MKPQEVKPIARPCMVRHRCNLVNYLSAPAIPSTNRRTVTATDSHRVQKSRSWEPGKSWV